MEYKPVCEGCGVALQGSSVAFICSYACTWCASCAEVRALVCPNCGGELVRRPRRAPKA